MFRILLSSLAAFLWLGTAHAANPQVRIETSLGEMRAELYPDKAPKTVENFLQYVREGHYDGTTFHRVIRGFMIQGGGVTTDLREKKARAPIANEANNGLKNQTGTLAMARTSDPHSATAQFFINHNNNIFLDFKGLNPRDYGYTVFGKVVAGAGVIDKIANQPTGANAMFGGDAPREPVVIRKISIVESQ